MPKINFSSATHQKGATGQILVLFLLALIVASLIMVFIGYQFGYRQGLHSTINNIKNTTQMSADITTLSAENDRLKQELSTANQERDISRNNLDQLRGDYENIKKINLQLVQVNDLLKSAVAQYGGVALNIIGSEIISLPNNTFEYRFDVAMVDVSGKAVTMVPKLTLLNATSMVEIPLQPASYEIKGVANIHGRFIMPEGFEPKQIKIEMTAGTQKVRQLYNWQIGKL